MENCLNSRADGGRKIVDLQPSLYEYSLPGPGDYYIPSAVPSGASYSFPQADRLIGDCLCQPLASSTSPSQIGQRRSKSAHLAASSQSPGPGSYLQPSTLCASGFTMQGKRRAEQTQSTPGPGQYDVDASPAPRLAICREDRFAENEATTVVTPGPGHYQLEPENSGPSYSISGKPRPRAKNTAPGPGSYEVPITRSLSPSIRGKPKEEKRALVPGPGSYDPCPSFRDLSFAQSKEERFKPIVQQPVPGDYNILNASPHSFSFSPSCQNPGVQNKSPGRGHYTIPIFISRIAARLRGKPSGTSQGQLPGPATYSQTRSQSVGFSFGRSVRNTEVRSTTPGPGSYNHHLFASAVLVTVKAKPRAFTPASAVSFM
jgi:hypothetical protein